MHTVRNRLASRPPTAMSLPGGKLPPGGRTNAASTHRGSMAIPLGVAEESALIESRAQRRRNPKGKKARKAAARLAAAREAEAFDMVAVRDIPAALPRAKPVAKKDKTKAKRARHAADRKDILPDQLPAIPAPPLLEQRLASALPLPSGSEPLVVAEPAGPVRLLTFAPAAERQDEAHVLPAKPEAKCAPDPEPVSALPELVVELEPEPLLEPEPAIALAAMADAPLPRARALVPVRRQGLIDVIAFMLRDSGRRLARWSARRHKTREEQAALRSAEARQLNLQRELEALDALRRAKG